MRKALSVLLVAILLPTAVLAQLSQWSSVQSDRAVRSEPNDFWYWHRITAGPRQISDYTSRVVYDPQHSYFWWMTDDYMNLPRAWGIVKCGSVENPPVIAFADTRFLVTHWDMGNAVGNPVEAAGVPGVDDDGNGLIDDILQYRVYGAFAEVTDDHDGILPPINKDTEQHGINMASMAVATTDNDTWWVGKDPSEYLPMLASVQAGVPGIAWNAPYVPIDGVFSSVNRDAFDYVCYLKDLGVNIRVLNCSWVGETQEMVDRLTAHGILVVTGTDNDDWQVQTASLCSPILLASAINKSYQRCLFSGDNYMHYAGASYKPLSGSTNNVDVCGYASSSPGMFHWNNDPDLWEFTGASFSTQSFGTLVCGWAYDTGELDFAVDMPLSIPGNGGVSPHSFATYPQVVPCLTQTDMRTSGATAQTSGVAALLFALYPQLVPEQAIGMIRRGCVSVDGENQSQCCSSDVESDCHYFDGEHYIRVQDAPCDGLLGAGKLDAYRTITLWGLIDRDTTLCGDVYLSGDVVIAGATVTVMPGTRFHVAPDDITYLDPWEPEARYDMSNARGDGKGYFEDFPTAPYDKIEIVLYDDSARLLFLSTPEHPAVFSSFVNDDGTDSDWIGINDRPTSVIRQPNGAGSYVIENAEHGVF